MYLVGLKKLIIFGMIGLAGCAGASEDPTGSANGGLKRPSHKGGCIPVCG